MHLNKFVCSILAFKRKWELHPVFHTSTTIISLWIKYPKDWTVIKTHRVNTWKKRAKRYPCWIDYTIHPQPSPEIIRWAVMKCRCLPISYTLLKTQNAFMEWGEWLRSDPAEASYSLSYKHYSFPMSFRQRWWCDQQYLETHRWKQTCKEWKKDHNYICSWPIQFGFRVRIVLTANTD